MPDIRIMVGDASEQLRTLPSGSAHCIFADPPYNAGIDYGAGKEADTLSDHDYLTWCDEWIAATERVLAPGGSLWVVICERWADEFGCTLAAMLPRRQRIIWRETFCQYVQTNFSTEHRHLFYHVKPGAPHTWNPDPIRVESARQKAGDKRGKKKRVPGSVWTIGRLAGTHTKRGRVDWHPAQLPIELLERVILCASNPGDTVLDVFAGSGSMGVACARHGRGFIGIELNPGYAELARRRIGMSGEGGADG